MKVPGLQEFQTTLDAKGIHAALVFLNKRTAHRFTGVYRYDGEMLRNVALVDKFAPDSKTGGDVTMGDAYCALVRDAGLGDELVFDDAAEDPRFDAKTGSPVVSYCGVLLRDAKGRPFGTLCHYDVRRCQAPSHDTALLHAAGPRLMEGLRASGLIVEP